MYINSLLLLLLLWKKIDAKEKIVGVAITPGSPPEQRNRAAERCYITERARKRAETIIIIIIIIFFYYYFLLLLLLLLLLFFFYTLGSKDPEG